MAMKPFSDQLSQVHLGRVVKEEPPDEGSDFSSFCYETVTKEEVILEDLEIHADGQPESVSGPPTEISLKCSECNRMFDNVKNRQRCEGKHKAIKLGTYACKFCGMCFGAKYNQVKHEETHKRDPSQKADNEGGSSTDITKDENGLFKCSDCGRTFQRRSLAVKCAKRHLAKRLGLYQCKICQLCAGTRSDLRVHELIHKRHETGMSPSTEVVKQELGEAPEHVDQSKAQSGHATVIPKKRTFKCSECNRRFDTVACLNRCVKRHNAIKAGRYKCPCCGKCWPNKNDLKRHLDLMYKEGAIPLQLDEDAPRSKNEPPFIENRLSVGIEKGHELKNQQNTSLLRSVDAANQGTSPSLEVVKQELEEAPETSTFYHATEVKDEEIPEDQMGDVVKEEEMLEDQMKHVEQSDSESGHAADISKERPFKCSECNRTFDKVAYLNRCVRRHNSFKAGLYKCTYCGMYWATNYELVRHVRIKHKQEATPESADQTSKDTSDSLSFSYETVKQEDHLIEGEALEQGRTEEDSRESLAEQCEDKVVPIATSSDIPKQRTRELSSRRDKDGFLNCPECDLRFTKRAKFRAHLQRHRALRLKLFECQFCKKCFAKKSVLETHLQIHTGRDPNKMTCDECSKVFKSKKCFEKHKEIHEKELLGQAYVCQICHEKFENRNRLYRHKKTHNTDVKKPQNEDSLVKEAGGGNFTCRLCEQTFGNLNEATDHTKKHMKIIERGCQCIFCGLRCLESTDYENHIKIHKNATEDDQTGNSSSCKGACEKSELPFHCKTCNVYFGTQSSLNIHLWKSKLSNIRLIELNAKDKDGFFNCSKCDYKSNKRNLFRTHTRNHRANERGSYTCDVCQKQCIGEKQLAIHKKLHEKRKL